MGDAIPQNTFAGGELSPSLYGRVDLQKYGTSVALCENFIARPYGGFYTRPGSYYIGEAGDSSAAVRLIPFRFSSSQNYVIELGDTYMRVYSNGARVGTVEVVTPWAAADLFELQYTQSADVITVVHQDYPPYEIRRLGAESWECVEIELNDGPFQPINTDTSITVYASASTGTSVDLHSSTSLFTASNVGQLLYLEQKNYGTPWEVDVGISTGDVRRSDGKYYQALNDATTGTLAPTHNADDWKDGENGVNWRYLHSGYGVVRITSVTSETAAECDVIYRIPDEIIVPYNVSGSITDIEQSPSSTTRCTSTGHSVTTGMLLDITIQRTFEGGAEFETITGTYEAYVIDSDTFDITMAYYTDLDTYFVYGAYTGTTTSDKAPTYKWAFSAFGGDQDYPGAVCYYQQRLCFGGTKGLPQTVWMSRTGDFHNFSISNPIVDDDSISFTLASQRMDTIRSLLPMASLIVFTSGGEWVVSGGDGPVTPSSIQTKLEGYRGAAALMPIGVGNTAVFLQDGSRVVRDIGYEFASDSFSGFDLMTFANHVTDGKSIVDWTYQQSPDYIIWCVRNDGVLLGLTYLREQQVVGWHRHDLTGYVESVCCIPEGGEDVLYLLVNRDGTRMIERIGVRYFDEAADYFGVDSGLTYDGTNTGSTTIAVSGSSFDVDDTVTLTASAAIFAYSAQTDAGDQIVLYSGDDQYRITILSTSSTTVASGRLEVDLPSSLQATGTTDWAWARDTVSGLGHLEGQTVAICADGFVHEQQEVSSGIISLDPPGTLVHVGLPITAKLQTLRLSVPGAAVGGKRKMITEVQLLARQTGQIKAGTTWDDLYEVKIRDQEGYYDVAALDGMAEVTVDGTWNDSGQVCIQVDEPVPAEILSISPIVVMGD